MRELILGGQGRSGTTLSVTARQTFWVTAVCVVALAIVASFPSGEHRVASVARCSFQTSATVTQSPTHAPYLTTARVPFGRDPRIRFGSPTLRGITWSIAPGFLGERRGRSLFQRET